MKLNILLYFIKLVSPVEDYLFSTCSKLPKNLHFVPPDTDVLFILRQKYISSQVNTIRCENYSSAPHAFPPATVYCEFIKSTSAER